MSQPEDLLNLFGANWDRLKLWQILNTNLAAEYRARMTDLRKRGYRIDCEINRKLPSENTHILTRPVNVYWRDGQGEFL